MKFDFIDQAKKEFPVSRLCHLMGISQSGYFAWNDRPVSRRQRADLVMIAHIRSAWSLSNGTYGSPHEGWLYLAVVIDLFMRRVIGWAVSDRLYHKLALKALEKAQPCGDRQKA